MDVGDSISFEFQKIEPIREEDEYHNFRVYLHARYGKINSPMKIDITTGDVITPSAVQYDFSLLFEDRAVFVMAYTLETREEPALYLLWERYAADNPYIGELEFHEVLNTVEEIAALLDL